MEKAERELRSELREEVGFERNTVWRDMVAMERRTGAVVLQVSWALRKFSSRC